MPDSAPRLLDTPKRTLLGPGPANVHPRVEEALARSVIGHMDPRFIDVLEEVCAMQRAVFRTKNDATIAVSGTGSAGMEAAVCNVVEPGDNVVIGMHGFFGGRIGEMVERYGGNVIRAEGEWGGPLDPKAVEAALDSVDKVKMVAVVHGETSTGVLQPLDGLADLAHDRGALFLIDCVTSLAGVPVEVDAWGVDIAYSGTQKCLGAPPGLAPVTFNERALDMVRARESTVANWYLDIRSVLRYWRGENGVRGYHHTAPVSMIYGLHQALAVILEEGLEARQARHRRNSLALYAGLEALGLELIVDPDYRAFPLTTVRVPEGASDAEVRGALLNDHNIEIGAGLGPFVGNAWRIGLMGYNSTPDNVRLFLEALETVLASQGCAVEPGAGVAAADRSLEAVAAG